MYIIYKTLCKPNGKIYIGQHKTDLIADGYIGSGKLIKRAIEKYGIENFTREILDIVYTHKDAKIKEEFFIDLYDSTNAEVGYNITKYAWRWTTYNRTNQIKNK